MTLRDFLLLLMQCASGDLVARKNAARAIAVAFPIVSVEAREDDTLLLINAGPLMKNFRIRITLERPSPH